MGVNKRLIGAGATDTGGGGAITPSSHFDVVTYSGNGSSQSITGLNFSPDFIWFKCRNTGGTDHNINDSARGVMKGLNPNTTAVEGNQSPLGVTSFDSSGFTVNDNSGGGAGVNGSGKTYVAWCWHGNGGTGVSNTNGTITSTVQANDAAGFSMVKYTGDGNSARTVGHGLSAKCDLVIIKSRDSADKWVVQLPQLGDNARMVLEGDAAKTDDSTTAQAGNATVFGIGGDNAVNKSSDNFIAYCFRNIAGYQKIGTYTGNSSTQSITGVGFKPRYLLIKQTNSTNSWRIFDSKRGLSAPQTLFANLNLAEDSESNTVSSFDSDGWTMGSQQGVNDNGDTYLYWAIGGGADDVTPTVEESLAVENWGGSDYTKNIMNNFRAGLVITRAKGEAHHWGWYDIVRGVGKWLMVNNSDAEQSGSYGVSAFNAKNTEFYGNHTPANSDYLNETYDGYFIKAAASTVSNSNGSVTTNVSANAAAGFSIVTYTGTGSNLTIGHGLSSAPEFVMLKKYSASGDWLAGVSDWTKYLEPNGDPAFRTASVFQNTQPTSTVVSLGTSGGANTNGASHIAYCWHSVTGFSKVGSYTGTGSLQTIVTGFTPDFVIIKNTTDADDWAVFSSYNLGGSVNSFNKTQADQAFANYTMFSQSNGFQVPSSSGMTNGSGKNYVYLAMKKNVTQDNTTEYNFNIKLYDGNGSANHYIDGFDFRPDLVIVKPYNATGQWSWFDSIRGAGNRLDSTNSNSATQNGATLQSFAFDGYTFGNESGNNTGEGNVAYAWRAGRTWLVNNDGGRTSLANVNQSAGFSIVRYIASGTTTTIGHGLGSTPKFIIAKTSNQGYDWLVYHTSVGNSSALQLQSNSAAASNSFMNNTSPTSTVFTAAGGNNLNYQSGNEIIAYCFDDVAGKRKFGTYNGNGSATGPSVTLGFQPDFLMVRRTDSGDNWIVIDSQQDTSNPRSQALFFNLTSSRLSSGFDTDFNATGFQIKTTDNSMNNSSGTYIYWAEKIH